MPSGRVMRKAKNQKWNDQDHAHRDVNEEHPKRELVRIGNALGPFHHANGHQISAGGAQQCHAGEYKKQEHFQSRRNGRLIEPAPGISKLRASRRSGARRSYGSGMMDVHEVILAESATEKN